MRTTLGDTLARKLMPWSCAPLLLVLLGLAILPSPSLAQDTGVDTTDASGDDGYARRVTWIQWDSGFRGTDLRVGDRIVGARGRRYTEREAGYHMGVGDASESRFWSEAGIGEEGDTASLLVERDGEPVEIIGKFAPRGLVRGEDGKRRFGAIGPVTSDKDGFTYDWQSWYRSFESEGAYILAGWDAIAGYDSRRYLAQVREWEPRLQILRDTYPGPFADAVEEDWQAMLQATEGEVREISDADLEYRKLGELRAAQVSQAADAAREAFLQEIGEALLAAPFPVPDPLEGDLGALEGKILELPELTYRSLVYETQRSYYRAGDRSKGSYVLDRHDPVLHLYFAAKDRYIEKVDPYLDDVAITFYGRVQEMPALVTDLKRNETFVALRVTPVAVWVENDDDRERRFFVDLRSATAELEAQEAGPEGAETDVVASFAGEDDLVSLPAPQLTDASGPDEVMHAFVEHIRRADFEAWKRLFGNWRVRRYFEGDSSHLWVDTDWITLGVRDAQSIWDKARHRLLEDVFDVRVARVEPVRVVYDAALQPGEPGEGEPRKVEEARVVVDHVGLFDGEYRTFAHGSLHRKWTLQRLDDGPWRIVEAHNL